MRDDAATTPMRAAVTMSNDQRLYACDARLEAAEVVALDDIKIIERARAEPDAHKMK
jgi:hypothetical protein